MSRPPALAPYAFFGGTFDPVHYGHLRAAESARDTLGIDSLSLLPCRVPPHRPAPGATPEQRLEMLNRAIADHPGLAVDERELRREGPSYMVDTLASMRDELGDRPVWMLLGQDAAAGLEQWHRWSDLFSLCHLVVMTRSGHASAAQRSSWWADRQVDDPDELRRQAHGAVFACAVDSLAISSTRIRDLLVRGRSARYLLPPATLEYIREQGLYRRPDRAR